MQYTMAKACILILLAGSVIGTAGSLPAKEFLTPKEIQQIQDNQEVDKRVKIYMEAAALRLKTVEERLSGKESEAGDPLEFFSVEEMLDGYYRIMRSVMFNIDDAVQNPATDQGKFKKALKSLKEGTENSLKELEILKRLSEEQRREELWNLVNQAVDITGGAHEGAELGLSRQEQKKP